MIRKFKVKGLRSPSLLIDMILSDTKEGILVVETDGEGQIKDIENLLKRYGLKYEVDGNLVKIYVGEIKADKTINVGATCPGPIMMVSDMLSKMKNGEILEIICGKNALTDLTEGLKGMGNEIIKVEDKGDGTYRV